MQELILIVLSMLSMTAPTYSELSEFLAHNEVSENQYVYGEYTCWNFTCDLLEDAHEADIPMVHIELGLDTGWHVIVAAVTSDKGLVFIEPQNDSQVYVEEQTVGVYDNQQRCNYLKEIRIQRNYDERRLHRLEEL